LPGWPTILLATAANTTHAVASAALPVRAGRLCVVAQVRLPCAADDAATPGAEKRCGHLGKRALFLDMCTHPTGELNTYSVRANDRVDYLCMCDTWRAVSKSCKRLALQVAGA
jgi:hypothetical protein